MTQVMSDAQLLGLIKATGGSTTATYTPSGGAASTIYVIFDNDAEIFNVAGDVIGRQPVAQARNTDLTGTILAGTLVVGGTTYTIEKVLADSEGMTDLALKES